MLMGSTELIPYFALLARMTFALPIKQSLFQPMYVLTFTLLFLSSIPLRERASRCVVFSCQLGLNYDNTEYCTVLLVQSLREICFVCLVDWLVFLVAMLTSTCAYYCLKVRKRRTNNIEGKSTKREKI